MVGPDNGDQLQYLKANMVHLHNNLFNIYKWTQSVDMNVCWKMFFESTAGYCIEARGRGLEEYQRKAISGLQFDEIIDAFNKDYKKAVVAKHGEKCLERWGDLKEEYNYLEDVLEYAKMSSFMGLKSKDGREIVTDIKDYYENIVMVPFDNRPKDAPSIWDFKEDSRLNKVLSEEKISFLIEELDNILFGKSAPFKLEYEVAIQLKDTMQTIKLPDVVPRQLNLNFNEEEISSGENIVYIFQKGKAVYQEKIKSDMINVSLDFPTEVAGGPFQLFVNKNGRTLFEVSGITEADLCEEVLAGAKKKSKQMLTPAFILNKEGKLTPISVKLGEVKQTINLQDSVPRQLNLSFDKKEIASGDNIAYIFQKGKAVCQEVIKPGMTNVGLNFHSEVADGPFTIFINKNGVTRFEINGTTDKFQSGLRVLPRI